MLSEVVNQTAFGKLKNLPEDTVTAMLAPLPGGEKKWQYPGWYHRFIKGDETLSKTLNRISNKLLKILSDGKMHHIHRGEGVGKGTIVASYELGWIKWDFAQSSCCSDCYGVLGITEKGQTIFKKQGLDFITV